MEANEKFEIKDGVLEKYTGHDEDIVVPNGVTEIGLFAFTNWLSAKSITYPEGITMLSLSRGPNVKKISLPATLERISGVAPKMLAEIEVAEGNPNFKITDGVLYSKDGKTLIMYPPMKAGDEFTVPDGVEIICENAFSCAQSLKRVCFPFGIKKLGAYLFDNASGIESIVIPEGVDSVNFGKMDSLKELYLPSTISKLECFGSCSIWEFAPMLPSLEKIEIDENNPNFKSIDNVIYSKDGKTLISYPPMNVGDEFTVPDGVEAISSGAFATAKFLKKVSLPNSVNSIDDKAFYGCKSLESVEMPERMRELGLQCFRKCIKLKSIAIPKEIKAILSATFESCISLESITLPDTLEEIYYSCFESCLSLESITLPKGLKKFPGRAFLGCKSLQGIALPDGITEIPEDAFKDCTSLKSVSLPEKLITIAASAFNNCSSLECLVFPKSTKKIAPKAFLKCASLKSAVFNDGLLEIGTSAFEKCTSLTYAPIPSSVKKMGKKAFEKCPLSVENEVPTTPAFATASPDKPVFEYEVKAKSCKATLVSISADDKELIFPREHEGKKVTEIAIERVCKNGLAQRSFDKVVVPGTVTKYASSLNCLKINSLIFEEGVKEITPIDRAKISDLYLPASLEVIKKYAFRLTNINAIHIPENSKLQYIGPGAFPFDRNGTIISPLLDSCVVEGDAVYLPSDNNPHFILLKVPNEGTINENTELVLPSKANESAVVNRTIFIGPPKKWVVPVTLRQILELEKKHGKCLYIDENWELRGEELFNAKGEKAGYLDSTVFITYFYLHGGYFWNQYDLGLAPPAPVFGYRGWKYLSEKKGHDYNNMASVILCMVKEDGDIIYDFDYDTGILGELDILSSPQAFNLINSVDSEAG